MGEVHGRHGEDDPQRPSLAGGLQKAGGGGRDLFRQGCGRAPRASGRTRFHRVRGEVCHYEGAPYFSWFPWKTTSRTEKATVLNPFWLEKKTDREANDKPRNESCSIGHQVIKGTVTIKNTGGGCKEAGPPRKITAEEARSRPEKMSGK